MMQKLELHVRRLNEARSEDKRQIQELARKLNNSHQEIGNLVYFFGSTFCYWFLSIVH